MGAGDGAGDGAGAGEGLTHGEGEGDGEGDVIGLGKGDADGDIWGDVAGTACARLIELPAELNPAPIGEQAPINKPKIITKNILSIASPTQHREQRSYRPVSRFDPASIIQVYLGRKGC